MPIIYYYKRQIKTKNNLLSPKGTLIQIVSDYRANILKIAKLETVDQEKKLQD